MLLTKTINTKQIRYSENKNYVYDYPQHMKDIYQRDPALKKVIDQFIKNSWQVLRKELGIKGRITKGIKELLMLSYFYKTYTFLEENHANSSELLKQSDGITTQVILDALSSKRVKEFESLFPNREFPMMITEDNSVLLPDKDKVVDVDFLSPEGSSFLHCVIEYIQASYLFNNNKKIDSPDHVKANEQFASIINTFLNEKSATRIINAVKMVGSVLDIHCLVARYSTTYTNCFYQKGAAIAHFHPSGDAEISAIDRQLKLSMVCELEGRYVLNKVNNQDIKIKLKIAEAGDYYFNGAAFYAYNKFLELLQAKIEYNNGFQKSGYYIFKRIERFLSDYYSPDNCMFFFLEENPLELTSAGNTHRIKMMMHDAKNFKTQIVTIDTFHTGHQYIHMNVDIVYVNLIVNKKGKTSGFGNLVVGKADENLDHSAMGNANDLPTKYALRSFEEDIKNDRKIKNYTSGRMSELFTKELDGYVASYYFNYLNRKLHNNYFVNSNSVYQLKSDFSLRKNSGIDNANEFVQELQCLNAYLVNIQNYYDVYKNHKKQLLEKGYLPKQMEILSKIIEIHLMVTDLKRDIKYINAMNKVIESYEGTPENGFMKTMAVKHQKELYKKYNITESQEIIDFVSVLAQELENVRKQLVDLVISLDKIKKQSVVTSEEKNDQDFSIPQQESYA